MKTHPLSFRHCALILIFSSALFITGCSNSSDPDTMQEIDENTLAEIDPAGRLANLRFLSAEDDASFQCLLGALTASAETRQLRPYGVYTEADAANRGEYATWCSTIGSGELVTADNSSCQRGLLYGIEAPGTQALQLFAPMDSSDGLVETFGHQSITVPNTSEVGWRLIYRRNLGSDNSFSALFTSFDGSNLNRSTSIVVRSDYKYTDNDIDLSETYLPLETPKAQLDQLRESSANFQSVIKTNYNALIAQVSNTISNSGTLSEPDKESALSRAATHIGERLILVEQNANELHSLMVEQMSFDECEQ